LIRLPVISRQDNFVEFSQIYLNDQVDPDNIRPEKWNSTVFTKRSKEKEVSKLQYKAL